MDPRTLPPSTLGTANADSAREPGLVLVFAGAAPTARVMPLDGDTLELGRGTDGPGKLDDGRASRRHATVTHDGSRFTVTDLGSQNGTLVDGKQIAANTPVELERVLRVGDSLLVPVSDIRPFEKTRVRTIDGFVRGPVMQAVLDEVKRAAQAGQVVHIRGESGTGKEGIARAFHAAGPRASGQLVPVNCAAIPQSVAERLLFGAKRGAYSGADQDAVGYLEEASGGTLFLDEVAELDAQVQAKLLRALESNEVLPLGASKPRRIDIGFCSATNKDLRALVGAGTFREDLYFRIGRPSITVPPLRNRPEEIAALVASELDRVSPTLIAHVTLVEQCLLRPWPGNIRELLAELRTAAHAALVDGNRVMARHLSASAGSMFSEEPSKAAATVKKRSPQNVEGDWRRRIEEALAANDRNVAATARALGLHRTQLRRLIERHGIDMGVTRDDDQ